MKKRALLITMGLVLVLSLVAIGCPPAPGEVVEKIVPWPGYPEPEFTWRIQSVWATGVRGGWEPFLAFTERVKELSRGRLVIEAFPDLAIVGTFAVFDATVAGVIDGFHSWPSYWTGKDPAFASLSGKAMSFPEQWMMDAWYWEWGGIELARELYAKYDLFFVGSQKYGSEIMQFTRPVDDLDDFAGLLFRTPAGQTADLLTRMGAAVTILPGGEIFTALEVGVIEGFEWVTISINFPMGFHRLAPYFIHPGFHMMAGATEFVVHMDVWNALPADLQAIVIAALREWSAEHYHRVRIEEMIYIERMLADGNVRMDFPEEDVEKIRLMAFDIWKEWAARSPMSGRILESKIAFQRHLGLIE